MTPRATRVVSIEWRVGSCYFEKSLLHKFARHMFAGRSPYDLKHGETMQGYM